MTAEEKLEIILDRFSGMSYTHYDVEDMCKWIKEGVEQSTLGIILDDIKDQDYSKEEIISYLNEWDKDLSKAF